ncbi:Dot/Icm T4SS effector kinase LegK1 [Legionella saoudiensis]|uniref:Dot/Icm T4SS effector kinase LegK1 n=1 Tax=Legionella saoudiensis TaxID=1750561 RepID=UPI00072FE363|nr:Dot/Icm T4SS effector kinase LegK1 [Legionella saoudiensis]
MPQIIDPRNLSQQNAKKLQAFFDSQLKRGIKVWQKGQIYIFADGSSFEFSSDVIWRQRKEGKSGVRYEFISERLLGKGAFGEVYEIEGTFALNNDSFQFKEQGAKGKKRAVKIQFHNTFLPKQVVLREYDLSTKTTHLAVKKPTLGGWKNNSASFTVLNKLPGRELASILQDDLAGTQILTVNDRIELSKALLKVLKEQVTDKGIIHRDIKPENILVDMSTKPFSLNIIDFGLSTAAASPDGEYPGTPLYKAPEIWDETSQSCKADVFSMARVIAELWNDKTLSMLMTVGTYSYAKTNAHQVDLNTLFSDIKDLDEENSSIIRAALKGMFHPHSNQRFSIDEAIEHFSHVHTSEEKANNAILTKAYPQSMNRIEAALTQVKILKKQEEALIKRGHGKVAKTLNHLIAEIQDKMEKLKYMSIMEYNQNVESYTKHCQTLINTNKEIFAHHRNVNYILANIALAIAGLGVLYLTAGLMNLAVTKGNNFLFFKETKTCSLVSKMKENLDEMEESIQQEHISSVIELNL